MTTKIMNKKVIGAFCTLSIILLSVLAGCKKSSASSETGIKSFTFASNDSAPDLRNITFFIDSLGGQIYNLDSVAYTSNITKVVPKVTCYSTPSEIRINDESWNQVDSIDASKPFKLTIVAANKTTTRDVTVTVVKHTVNSNEILWYKLNNDIPVKLSAAKVFILNGLLVLVGESADGNTKYVYTSEDASTWVQQSSGSWNFKISTLYLYPNLVVEGLFALGDDNSLYVMSSDYTFKKSADIPAGYTAIDIIGAYDIMETEMLIFAKNNKNENAVLRYQHDGTFKDAGFNNPSSFPEQGYAAKFCNTNTSSIYESGDIASYLIGGVDKGGNILANVFSSDNAWYWTDVRKFPLEEKIIFPAVKNASASYYDKKIFLIGGQCTSGYIDQMYISDDNGYSWYGGKSYNKIPFADYRIKYGCNVVSDNYGNLYVIGGYTDSGEFVLDSYKGRARHFDFKR